MRAEIGRVFALAAVAFALLAAETVTTTQHSHEVPVEIQSGTSRVEGPPTFNADVAPILYANCASCHRPGELAPMSLLTYRDVSRSASAIRRVVGAREMPPWYADRAHGAFRNERGLTDAQIDTLVSWIDGRMPEGDGAPPPPPEWPEGWDARMGRPPDQVIELPSGFGLPADAIVPVFTIWLKPPAQRERFIQAIELRPSNRRVVHHASVSVAPLPPGTTLGEGEIWPGGPVLDGVPVYADGRPFRAVSSDAFGKALLFYVPGGGVMQFPDGIAKRLSPEDYLVWELHLTTTGKPEQADLRLGLWYSQRPVHHEVFTWTVNERLFVDGQEVTRGADGRERLPNIPPHAKEWPMTGVLKLRDDVTLYALWPHMHFRGKDMKFVLTHPGGRDETLLAVPHYNPHWQITYELAMPLKIRAGSTITAYGHYDNSTDNPHNPDPDAEVRFGLQAHNEMFLPLIEVTVDKDDLRHRDRR